VVTITLLLFSSGAECIGAHLIEEVSGPQGRQILATKKKITAPATALT
jgi:hypothetical protein